MCRVVAWCLLVALQACSGTPVIPVIGEPAPPIIAVSSWGGQPTSFAAEPQRITRITLHHQGETWRDGDDVAPYLRRLQQWSRESRHWADIPYHYVVSPDGRIYAARPLALAGDTNTEYDPQGHALVMLLGNFENVEPTAQQLNATVELMAWLAREHGLAPDSIASHRDFSAQTVCPGRNLYRYIENGWLVTAVDRRLRGLPTSSP